MPAFRYEAVNAAGATSKGVLQADSPRAARSDLRARGLVPLALDAIAADTEGQPRRSFSFGDKLSTVELALFTRQLASLLESNLPLEQAFDALMEQAERPYLRDLIASIRAEVMGGSSLSDALPSARLCRYLPRAGRFRRAYRPARRCAVAAGRLCRAP